MALWSCIRNRSFALLASALVMPSAFAATVNINGGTSVYVAGTSGASAFVVGYGSSQNAIPSTFSSNFQVNTSDGTPQSSGTLQFLQIPYASVGGSLYFALVLDAQEVSSNQANPQREALRIDWVRITVGSTLVWQTTDSILLNATAPFTLTPLGNGADMAIFIPVSIFNGFNLTGSTTFVFTAQHSLGDNGSDEWIFTDRGIGGGTQFFGANQIIQAAEPVPEPSTWALSLLGAAALALRSRKRRA
jgi:hypothetical protein